MGNEQGLHMYEAPTSRHYMWSARLHRQADYQPSAVVCGGGMYKMPASLDAGGAADVAGAERLVGQAALQQP